jgi:hypothetical protein
MPGWKSTGRPAGFLFRLTDDFPDIAEELFGVVDDAVLDRVADSADAHDLVVRRHPDRPRAVEDLEIVERVLRHDHQIGELARLDGAPGLGACRPEKLLLTPNCEARPSSLLPEMSNLSFPRQSRGLIHGVKVRAYRRWAS